ncbi:MAG TPA: amidohydrolase family protein [Nitrolancea sp.]|jgi:imidazolonepropionase-like amidohydrolase|nr:amidohydrolase family protein [Nitrolancea sp.]
MHDQQHPTSYAVSNASLIDGAGGPPIAAATVLVHDGKIVAVGRSDDVSIPSDMPVYNLDGKTLMPGLIDGHVHLRSYAGTGHQDVHLWNVLTFIEEQTLHGAANAIKALESGVTTVRDMAGGRVEISVKHVMDAGILPGARVIASGFVGMTAGHGDMFVPPAIEQRMWPPVDGVDACRKLIREYARDGADLIKLCTSGGVLSLGDKSEWRNYTMEETQAIVDEAHALGKPVAAHAHTRAGIEQALVAGVDTLEHGTHLDDELIEMMLERRTWLCPTLSIGEYLLDHGVERGVPAESLAKARETDVARQVSMRKAYQAGVRIFMGTDSCNTMAFGGHARELELMHRRIGMTLMETIVAATASAADALGIGDRTGTIACGKSADLLVVDGDPLADITILQDRDRLLGIFREGRLLVDRGLPRLLVNVV